jgi:hypothetical protein
VELVPVSGPIRQTSAEQVLPTVHPISGGATASHQLSPAAIIAPPEI